MATYTSTYSGDLTTTVASKLSEAVAAAATKGASAKALAVKSAAKYGVDPMLRRGEFFGKALKYQFTPGFLRGGKSFTDQFDFPDYIARGQKSELASPLPSDYFNRGQTSSITAQARERRAGNPFPFLAVGGPAMAAPADTPGVEKETPMLPSSSKYGDTVNRPVKVKDEKLILLVQKIAESLTRTVNAIGEKQGEIDAEIQSSKESSLAIARGLSVNTDTISEKLDAIAEILNQQLALDKKVTDDKETEAVKRATADVDDLADTDAYVKLGEKTVEVAAQNEAEDQARERQNQSDGPEARQLDIPDLETGGIVSGPDSGYLVRLHGDEMVTPLDNNYTQGEPSAVDGKIRPVPQYEMGTSKPTVAPAPKTPIVNAPTLKRTDESDATSADLIEAMKLPNKVAGLITLTNAAKAAASMPGGAPASTIASTVRPITKAFNITDQISNKISTAVMGPNTGGGQEPMSVMSPAEQFFNSIIGFFGGVGNAVGSFVGFLTGADDDKGEGGKKGYGGLGGDHGIGGKMATQKTPSSYGTGGPTGLARGLKGVRAGFTGMNAQGFNAMMQGESFIPSNKPQILGKGAYSAPTFRGAERYAGTSGSLGGRQLPGGVVNSIVPGNSPRINFIEPQSKVSAGMFNKGRDLATKLQGGAYPNSVRANMLRSQITSGGVRTPVRGGVTPTHPLIMLAQMLIEDLISPQPTAAYDQVTGPNAMYNNPKLSEEQRRVLFESVHGTQMQGAKTDFVNLRSQEQALNRIDKSVKQPDPIVINNQQTAATASEERFSRISNMGDPGFGALYPSPYN